VVDGWWFTIVFFISNISKYQTLNTEKLFKKYLKPKELLRCTIILCLMLINVGVTANELMLLPSYNFKKNNDTFYIDVYCIPSEPVKAFEFKIRFNQTKMICVNVTEGDFFSGYSTFFSPDILIDNINGTILNIYNFIIGQGNVSNPGICVTIEFIAINGTGISFVELFDDGITNETQYLQHVRYNNAVQFYDGFPPWDVNQDGKVNAIDVSIVVFNYGNSCIPGSEQWDIKNDGICNAIDVSLLVANYGVSY
jgi:hypothetical protein